jgi:hypothetical protein
MPDQKNAALLKGVGVLSIVPRVAEPGMSMADEPAIIDCC